MTPLRIIRGDDVTIPVTFTNSQGDPINLTDATVYFTVKPTLETLDEDATIQQDITDHSAPLDGQTEIVLTNADTSIPVGIYVWDLQIKDTNNKISSTTAGKLEILQDITTRS